ncbi:type II toxin-antitoxin system CcdA family antitoxin [Streptosporangium amethystogenes]|uniref:type II toxin-antitoxin system CcdA family antitoxin n=1 Tax=Streptosporangium amethystogenes TaxID=2002 RepID=UPI0012F8ABCA|nr:type II toxin-antitoxin system CcdA family antitoxin [Streptosporangium amethystogenes]
MAAKETVSVTVDHDLLDHAGQRVGTGSLSAYVNEALALKLQRERHRRALWNTKAADADPDHVARMMAHVESQ